MNLEQRKSVELFQQIAGPVLMDYFQNFDLKDFVLQKVGNFFSIGESQISNIFDKKQQMELNKLLEEGYIETIWQETDDRMYTYKMRIRLSDLGKLTLFKRKNKKEIQNFIEILESLGYSVDLLDTFLKSQDLDRTVWNILDTFEFSEWCKNTTPKKRPYSYTFRNFYSKNYE